MAKYRYNKQVALKLCEELIETANRIAEAVQAGPDEGEMLDVTCERLGIAISQLKTQKR